MLPAPGRCGSFTLPGDVFLPHLHARPERSCEGPGGRIGASGCSAAWIAHLTGGQGVGSSNLPSPTACHASAHLCHWVSPSANGLLTAGVAARPGGRGPGSATSTPPPGPFTTSSSTRRARSMSRTTGPPSRSPGGLTPRAYSRLASSSWTCPSPGGATVGCGSSSDDGLRVTRR